MKFLISISILLTTFISTTLTFDHQHNNNNNHKRFIKSVIKNSIGDSSSNNLNLNGNLLQESLNTLNDYSSSSLTTRNDNNVLEKRGSYSGQATFYNADGMGACGSSTSNSQFIVALDQALYGDMGKVSSFCFQTITIYANGKSHTAQIVDACPSENGGCQYGSLDMSPTLFNFFSTPDAGVFQMSWSIGGNDQPEPTTTKAAPSPVAKTTSIETPSPTPTPKTTSTTPTYTPPTTSEVEQTNSIAHTPSSTLIPTTQFNSTFSPLTTSSLNNSTSSTAANSTTPIPSYANSPQVTSTTILHPSGNLDRLSQVVLGLAGLVGSSAMEAKNHY